MKLHEHQAKEIFKKFGIPVLPGDVAETPEQARMIAREIGKPVVVKAQVLVGGRGKAGGIQLARDPQEAYEKASSILGMSIKGLRVKKVLVTQAVTIKTEHYIGIVMDRDQQSYTAMACAEGGVDIEEVASRSPEKIAKFTLDPYTGFLPYQARGLVLRAGFDPPLTPKIGSIFVALYSALVANDADLVEINPLALTPTGEVFALDAKMTIDDNALFRHQDLLQFRELEGEDLLELEARSKGIAFVRLEGDIGIVGNGAGLVMATMDAVKNAGGRPACFLDLGGGSREEKVREALTLLLKMPTLKGIFINIFGGITRGDEVARGLLKVHAELHPAIPTVIRMTGTRAKEGLALLHDSPLIPVEDMEEGAKKIVQSCYGVFKE